MVDRDYLGTYAIVDGKHTIKKISEKGVSKMNRLLSIVAVVSILSFGLVANSHAHSITPPPSFFTTYHTTKLVGLTVMSGDGGVLGTLDDLVVDSNGHLDFAIVRQPNIEDFSVRYVVVPFSILKITKTTSDRISVVFNADRREFYTGPSWGFRNLDNPQEDIRVDRHYGVAPYWTGATGTSEHYK